MKTTLIALGLAAVLAGCEGSPAWHAAASEGDLRAYYGQRCTMTYGIAPGTLAHSQCMQSEVQAGEARRMAAGQALMMYGAMQSRPQPVYVAPPPVQVVQF